MYDTTSVHTDPIKALCRQTVYYYNKKCAFSNNAYGFALTYAAASFTGQGWSCWKVPVVDDWYENETDCVPAAYVSNNYNDETGDVIIRISVSNNTATDVAIKSISYLGQLKVYSNTSSTSTTNSNGIIMYKNLDTDIIIPANDSVFIDITLSAGDVSDVSVG